LKSLPATGFYPAAFFFVILSDSEGSIRHIAKRFAYSLADPSLSLRMTKLLFMEMPLLATY
jgi:hypothetical protein